MRAVRNLICCVLLTACAAPSVRAAPNDKEPAAPFAVRNAEENKALLEQVAKLDATTRPFMSKLVELREQGQLKQVRPAQIEDAYVAGMQMKRLAKRLMLLGETAGVDYDYRAREVADTIGNILPRYVVVPGVDKLIQKELPLLQREAARRVRIVPKLERLAKAGNWKDAEDSLYEALDAIERKYIWQVGRIPRKVLFGQLGDAQTVIDKKMAELRLEEAAAALTADRQAEDPGFEALLDALDQATAAIGSSGTAQIGDQQLDGPATVAFFGARWQEAQFKSLRTLGLAWAQGLSTGGSTRTELDEFLEAQQIFSEQITAGLVAIVETDAGRASEADAPRLYAAYLDALGPLVSLTNDKNLAPAFEKALAKLAGKSPQLAADVAAYRAATGELMRWRRRTVEAVAADLKTTAVPSLGATMRGVFKPTLARSAPATIEEIAGKLVGKIVYLEDLVGLGTGGKTAIARYRDRNYARVPLPQEQLAAEVQGLERDLLATDQTPLTLEAATLLATARRGDMNGAAGKVMTVYLEGLPTRFASLTPGGRFLVRLGPLPRERKGMRPLAEILLRLDLQPTWLLHELLYVPGE